MGSGKTTIGRILAKELHIPFIDLDEYIESEQGKSINEIFESNGEIFFRKLEHLYLNKLINEPHQLVISLGGGTPCYANNHLHFEKENVSSFYLKGSVKTLASRLKNQINQRPLLNNNNEDLETYIAKHLFDRSYFYNKAKFKISVDEKTIQETILEINQYINKI